MNKYLTLIVIILNFGTSCQSGFIENEQLQVALNAAGKNKTELQKALKEAPREQKEAVAFLIANMPERDLISLTADYILENTRVAYEAREKFSWCSELPDSIFFNDVLPYASINERRDNWRQDFMDRFSPFVETCNTIFEAIDSVAFHIEDIVGVEYNTKREKADQSPYESIEQGMATCTGLSVLLTNALRSVGIPARMAGTPLWTNMRGNHSWCEVFADGEWYFIEYYPDKLNHSWFLADAGKADPEKPIHWIYATSFKKTGLSFPCVWDKNIKYIPAVNVTDRYIKLYEERIANAPLKKDEILLDVVLYKNHDANKDTRLSEKVMVFEGGKQINFGYSPSSIDDLNKYLKFKLKKNTEYVFKFDNGAGELIEKAFKTAQETELVKLYQNL